MTYEELFVAIDEAAPKLPGCALRLLLHLIATSIKSGTNEVRASVRALATEMGMTKDAVTVASRSLSEFVEITAAPGVPTVFILPPEWFTPQRSLFAPNVPVEKVFKRPGLQDSSGRITRTPLGEKPGHSVPITRTQWADYQDAVGGKPGQLGGKPGHSVPITRTDTTQDQQLSGHATHRSIDPSSVLPECSVDRIDQICGAVALSQEQHSDAQTLSEHLRGYMSEFGPRGLAVEPPDERILARCLACASLGELITLLRKMHSKAVRAGDGYAWFVAVFAHQLAGIKSEQLRAAMRAKYHRKPAQRSSNPLFGPQLVQQASAGVRHF